MSGIAAAELEASHTEGALFFFSGGGWAPSASSATCRLSGTGCGLAPDYSGFLH